MPTSYNVFLDWVNISYVSDFIRKPYIRGKAGEYNGAPLQDNEKTMFEHMCFTQPGEEDRFESKCVSL